MTAVDDITVRVKRMRADASIRDANFARIERVRSGQIHDLMPDAFSDDLPRSVAANFIDTAARDISELIAPLPTLEFNDESFQSQAKKNFASLKTNIGYGYWFESNLQLQMFSGSDRYLSYGFLPFLVEPDYDAHAPKLYALNPRGTYYMLDRNGMCTVFVQVLKMVADELAQMFPEYRTQILAPTRDQFGGPKTDGSQLVELVRYFDRDSITCYMPERGNLILGRVPNPLGKCPVVVAERPGIDGPKGQFDDAIEVQLARAMMARMGLDAAYKSVNAPLVVPEDVNEFPIGPDVVLRTRDPQGVKRVGMELPPGAFQSEQMLEAELRLGTRYPDARSGEVQASVVTGRGVQALQGTIDTQIKTAQFVFGLALARATSLMFEMDEKVWPSRSRTFYATLPSTGTSISETYTPLKDIRGDYRCDCVYGFAAGLGVNQAVVLIEQMVNGGLLSRAAGMRQLPLGLDAIRMEREIMQQQLRDGLLQGVTAMAQSTNVVIEQGGDPSKLLTTIAQIIRGAGQGKDIEDLVAAAFPPPPPQAPAPPGSPAAGPGQGEGGAPPGQNDLTGLPMGTAQAGQAPGGRPSLQMLLSGLSPSGKANLQDNIAQRVPSVG